MTSNLDRYAKELDALIAKGGQLINAHQYSYNPDGFKKAVAKGFGKDKKAAKEFIDKLPDFDREYQAWYSEAFAVLKQILPDRLADFVRHYEKPKSRKDITFENYRIEDALQGLTVTRGYEKQRIAGPEAAATHLSQQLGILKAAKARFSSSLYDIRQMVMADLFDSELDAAGELLKHGFERAAGAMAGVVLEKHLAQVCDNHNVKITKKHPTISDFNDALKTASAIDLPAWRFHQHLADIRNICDHGKARDPTPTQVRELLDGVAKVVKTTF